MPSRMVRFSSWITLIGCVTLLIGLGWDALLHSADPHLAEQEGIFTLSNPGHFLFATGIAIVVLGIVLFLAGHSLDRALPMGRMAYTLLLLGVLILAFGAFSAANASGGNLLHDDHQAVASNSANSSNSQPGAVPVIAQAQSTPTLAPTMPDMPGMGASSDGTSGTGTPMPAMSTQMATQMATMPDMPGMSSTSDANSITGTPMPGMEPGMHMDSCTGLPITAADQTAVNTLISNVKTQAARFADVNTALSEGYQQITAYTVPGANGKWGPAHFLNMNYTVADISAGQPINPANPGALVYFRMPNGKMMLLGEMFIAPVGKGTCLGGGLTVWHSHSNLCFKNGTQQVAGNTDAQGNCPVGTTNHDTADMMHVWVFDNPDGPLAMDLTKQDYTAAYEQCLGGSAWCNPGT